MRLTKTTFFLGCMVGGMGAAVLPLLLSTSKAEPKLLPFQGRLTDASGTAVADGARVVEFKMYDAPTGGSVKWAGEVHNLSINGGLVNTMLGSKASLGGVDFASGSYLQITVDANGDGQITAGDPPLLPRQSVVPAVFAMEAGNARDSVKLAGADWSVVLVNAGGAAVNDPSAGFLNGGKLRAGSIDGAKLAAGSVGGGTAGSITDGSVTKADLGTGAVASDEIEDGSIQAGDLSLGLQNSVTPPGAVMAYAATVAPLGWELCDGRAVGRTDPKFAGLFAIIGVSHGSGNSTTMFNLPDYRGRFLRGVEDPDGVGGVPAPVPARDPDAAGRSGMAAGGSSAGAVGSVQEDELKRHDHKISGDVHSALPAGNEFIGIAAPAGNRPDGGQTYPDKYQNSISSVGGSETRPKNACVNFLIKL